MNITETSHRNKADQLEEHIANVQKENNDFVFMGYHGFEAIEVLQNLANAKVLKGIPLICSPFNTARSHTTECCQSNLFGKNMGG